MITAPKTAEERNERLDAVLAAIEANPEHWDQRVFGHRGTCHCFSGIAQLIACGVGFDDPRFSDVFAWRVEDAGNWLGLPWNEQERLIGAKRTLADIKGIVAEIKATPMGGQDG